jgi:hypothetical protein
MSPQLFAENILEITSSKVSVEDTVTVVINLNNDQAAVAFQIDIPVPSSLEFVPGSVELNPDRITDHTVSASLLSTGVLRIVCHSPSNAAFKGNKGKLVSFRLQAKAVPGDYTLQFSNAILSDENASNILTGTQSGTITVLGPDIGVSSDTLDFGRVPLHSNKDVTVTLTNNGNTNLHIGGIHASNSWFSVTGDTIMDIAAGSSTPIAIHFDAQVRNKYNETLDIISDDPDESVLRINLKAIAFAVNELHTANISSYSGKQTTLNFSMNNMNPITGIQFDLSLPSPMHFVSGSAFLTSRKTDHSVSVQSIDSVTLRVVAYSTTNQPFTGNDGKILSLGFLIQGTGGMYDIKLSHVILSDTSAKNVVSAFTGGTLNIAAADIDAPHSLSFGDVPVSTTLNKFVTVTNKGNDTLKISSVKFADTVFFSTQEFPINILPGKTFNLPVSFHKNTEGKAAGSLQIFSNDPDEYPFIIQLSGYAYFPNYLSVKDSCYSREDDTIYVEITTENVQKFVALQFDLVFPSGQLKCLPGEVRLTSRATDQKLSSQTIASDTLRILAYSMTHSAFKANSGPVVRIPFLTVGGASGDFTLQLHHAILADSSSHNILWETRKGIIQISNLPDRLPSPSGADSIDTYLTTQSDYTITADSNADWYHWHLLPKEAGSLESNSTKATVIWNSYFKDTTAYLYVMVGNTCDSISSDTLAIYVYSTVGISKNTLNTPQVVLAPNPSNGKFLIKLPPLQGNMICNVIDLTGHTICQKKVVSTMTPQNISLDLSSYGKGIYYLQFIYQNQIFVKKALVTK